MSILRFGSKVVFFGVIIEKDDDDDDDDNIEGRGPKPVNDEVYGDASLGFEVKVGLGQSECHDGFLSLRDTKDNPARNTNLQTNALCRFPASALS